MYTHVCIYICMYIHIIYKYMASPPASTHQSKFIMAFILDILYTMVCKLWHVYTKVSIHYGIIAMYTMMACI